MSITLDTSTLNRLHAGQSVHKSESAPAKKVNPALAFDRPRVAAVQKADRRQEPEAPAKAKPTGPMEAVMKKFNDDLDRIFDKVDASIADMNKRLGLPVQTTQKTEGNTEPTQQAQPAPQPDTAIKAMFGTHSACGARMATGGLW